MIRPTVAGLGLCRGNSIMTGLNMTFAQTIPGQIAAEFPANKVECLAASGITTPDLSRISPAQCDTATNHAFDVATEITNDVAYGANAGNGTAAGTAALTHIRSRSAVRPATKHFWGDCLPRSGVSGAVTDAANLVLSNALTVATADPTVWASNNADLTNCWLIKQSLITPRTIQVDNIHPDVSYTALLAAKYVVALGIAGIA